MPDPEKKTISATESPALLGASPYLTRWMLWQKFANGVDIGRPAHSRMDWGKKMQPLILEQVAADKKLEVIPNVSSNYVRRGLLGCTHDASIVSPDHGPGALEIKCVFDYKVWATKWHGGTFVPREYEIQLQQQMFVGDGADRQLPGTDNYYHWGLIVVWVCAELYYFERKPIPVLWELINAKASDFLTHVKYKDEPNAPPPPDPFGAVIEMPLLAILYPTIASKVLDLSAEPEHVKSATKVSDYKKFKEDEDFSCAAADDLRGQLLALAKDAERVMLPCGISYRIRKVGKGKMIVPYVPDVLLPPPPSTKTVGF